MSWSRFSNDFALDHVILRRIQRANQGEDQDVDVDTDEGEEEEEEDMDQSVVAGASRTRRVKSERT